MAFQFDSSHHLVVLFYNRCFGQSSPTLYGNIDQTCGSVKQRLGGLSGRDWTIVGEYSLCLDNTTVSEDPQVWDRFATFYWAAQNTAYSGSGPVIGSFFWNFKISTPNLMWDFLAGIKGGWMPQQPSDWSINGCP